MGISFGEGLMAFVGGAAERAREIDTESQKKLQKVAELKAKRQNELLKNELKAARDSYSTDEKTIEAIKAAGGIATPQGQVLAGGYKDIGEMQKAMEMAGDDWEAAAMPTLGDRPEAKSVSEEDYMKNTSGTTLGRVFESMGGPAREVTESTAEPVTAAIPTYRRGKPTELTAEEKEKISGFKVRKQLDSEKKADMFFNAYQDEGMFPELQDFSIKQLKRLAFDVANKQVSLTAQGIPFDMFQETRNSLGMFKQTPDTGGQQATDTKPPINLADTTIPAQVRTEEKKRQEEELKTQKELAKEERKTQKELAKEARKTQEKLEAEQRAVESTVPSKVTPQDQKLSGAYLASETQEVDGESLTFMDELSDENKNKIEIDVAGNVNAIINQTRMSQQEAYDLASAISKSGLTYKEPMLGGIFSDEFNYSSPVLGWKDVYDTYNNLKPQIPNLTYDMVVKKIIEKQK